VLTIPNALRSVMPPAGGPGSVRLRRGDGAHGPARPGPPLLGRPAAQGL